MVRFSDVGFETIRNIWVWACWHQSTFPWSLKPIKPLYLMRTSNISVIRGVMFMIANYDENEKVYTIRIDNTCGELLDTLLIDKLDDEEVLNGCLKADALYQHNLKKLRVITMLKEKAYGKI